MQNQENAKNVADSATHILEGEEIIASAAGLINDSALVYSLIVRSTYNNPDRNKYSQIGILLKNTDNSGSDNLNYQLNLQWYPSHQTKFHDLKYRLHDLTKLYQRLDNDPNKNQVDKYGYLDFLSKAKWYGPYAVQQSGYSGNIYMALTDPSKESYAVIVTQDLRGSTDYLKIDQFKVSTWDIKQRIAP